MQHTFHIDDSSYKGMRIVEFLKKLSKSKDSVNVIEEIEDAAFLERMKCAAKSGRVKDSEIDQVLDEILNG